jgi:hypothetical protein
MTLSGGVRVVTTIVLVLVLAVPLLVWSAIPGLRLGPGSEVARWATLLLPVVVVASWALAPRALEIGGGELRVLRRAWPAAGIPLGGIEEVAQLPPGALRGAVRTFGVGGLFGFYGWFYKKGPFRLFATRSDRLVEVVAGGRRVVVSPDEPARFVDGILASAPRARLRQPGEPGAASASRRS